MKIFKLHLDLRYNVFTYLAIVVVVSYSCSTSHKNIHLLEEPLHNHDSTYVKHLAYSLSYDENTEQAKWVAYELKASELVPNFKRTNHFKPDTVIITGTASNTDYNGSGYDRGHLAPAADMVWNKQAMNESFLYSNISPQLPAFNRGIWKVLEAKERELVTRYGSLYITCGPVFLNSDSTIGKNEVGIPTHFFKTFLVYNSENKQSIGFLFPHDRCKEDIFYYAVMVDSIERLIDLDLYHKLPDRIEFDIESEFNLLEWQ